MRHRVTHVLSIVGQALASAAALSALAGSIAISAHTTQTSRTGPSDVDDQDTFEVASIRPVDPQGPGGLQAMVPCSGGFELTLAASESRPRRCTALLPRHMAFHAWRRITWVSFRVVQIG